MKQIIATRALRYLRKEVEVIANASLGNRPPEQWPCIILAHHEARAILDHIAKLRRDLKAAKPKKHSCHCRTPDAPEPFHLGDHIIHTTPPPSTVFPVRYDITFKQGDDECGVHTATTEKDDSNVVSQK